MPIIPRPFLAVRLIGPTDAVPAHTAALAAQLPAHYGRRATCRTSPRPPATAASCAPTSPSPARRHHMEGQPVQLQTPEALKRLSDSLDAAGSGLRYFAAVQAR